MRKWIPITSSMKNQPQSLTRKLLQYALYAILPIVLFRFYFYPLLSSLPPSSDEEIPLHSSVVIASSLSSASNPREKESRVSMEKIGESEQIAAPSTCDYTNGRWVHDKKGPLYNGSSCGTIKYGRNCMGHGREDLSYLYWRWQPWKCKLPRFDPQTFLSLLRDKHLAFVGDSMARNQLESLLCMLGSVSRPILLYSNGDDNKFRRWNFPSHNLNVSVYWSPFLVNGVEKSNDGPNYNKLYFDSVDERWASDLDSIDMIVLSIGHWFLHPAVYYERDVVLGCHVCEGQNYTEIGFYDVFGKAFKTSLRAIIERKGSGRNGIDVIVTTFSPHHFEGEWDKLGACPKTMPYKEEEKALEGMDSEMRSAEVREVEEAKANVEKSGESKVRIEALDVTKLALLRPDGHPGPYMHPFPFSNGVKDRVQNDCVHWCLPGPIDMWNEIMLDVMRRWKDQPTRGK